MKFNVFKIRNGELQLLIDDLTENGYQTVASLQEKEYAVDFYLRKKFHESKSWIHYYKDILTKKDFDYYTNDIINESISGAFIVRKLDYAYAVVHGQAHFVVRKYCDKDFGLDLAERIIDVDGLKMKHSQTFTSANKKDITSYGNKRKFDDSYEYGEAFSYVKCKTKDKKIWGESVDFGESARFSLGKDFEFGPKELYKLTDNIEFALKQEPLKKLPRYRKVTDKTVLEYLDNELKKNFIDFITKVSDNDYWLTGVSFYFSDDYRYSLKYRVRDLTEIMDCLDASTIRDTVIKNIELIGDRYDLIKVFFYDENDEVRGCRKLIELMQVTVEYGEKYYVLFNNEWVEFSESYVSYIKEQVDGIKFEHKPIEKQTETELIDNLVAAGKYKQLHKENVYVSGYCIEKADLMDDENVIMIKDQRNQADLVYLIKQATTSLRLSAAGETGENVFEGRNVCLWMLVDRKKLNKLSDFKSFHLLDAINDFKREVVNKNLIPVIWVSLKKE